MLNDFGILKKMLQLGGNIVIVIDMVQSKNFCCQDFSAGFGSHSKEDCERARFIIICTVIEMVMTYTRWPRFKTQSQLELILKPVLI